MAFALVVLRNMKDILVEISFFKSCAIFNLSLSCTTEKKMNWLNYPGETCLSEAVMFLLDSID